MLVEDSPRNGKMQRGPDDCSTDRLSINTKNLKFKSFISYLFLSISSDRGMMLAFP